MKKALFSKLENKRIRRNVLILILCFAVLLRILFIIFYWTDKPLTLDMKEYILLGRNIAQGKGFNYGEEEALGAEHYSRPPLYPFFLAGIFSLFGTNLYIVRIIQALLGGINCILIYLIAQRIINQKAGIIAAFISAIYLPFIWYSAHILSEVLFSTLFLTCILFLFANNRHNKQQFIAGMFLGLSVLCRPIGLFFLPFALVWLLFNHWKSFADIAKAAALFLVGFILIVAPWIIRNYVVEGQFVLVHSSGGVTFWLSNHPLSLGDGDLAANPQLKAAYKEFLKKHVGYNREDLDRVLYREAFTYIKNNPFKIIILDLKKLFYFWIPVGPSMQIFSFKHKATSYISYFPCLFLSILGIYISRNQWKKNFLIYLTLLSFTVSIMVFYPQERFRIPVVDPCLIIFASFTLSYIINRRYKTER
jgi:4-amino-4-deoxy-L-arabinose transferase-like glycosyltransferase